LARARSLLGRDPVVTNAPAAIAGWITIKVLKAGIWSAYATSWQGLAASSLALPGAAAPSTTQLYGANSLAIRQLQWTDLTAQATELDVLQTAARNLKVIASFGTVPCWAS
jgi:hypothetical protein